MTTKLSDMTIDEVSLVDDPANGEARVLIVKAKYGKPADAQLSEENEGEADDETMEAGKKKPAFLMKKFREALEDAELNDEQLDAVNKAAGEFASAINETKTASAAKEKTMDLETLSKALGEAEAKLVALEKRADEAESELAEKNEIIKQKDAEIQTVSKSAGENEEEILKSLPEAIRKRLQESEAAAKEAADTVQKMKDDTELKDAIAKAKTIGVGEPDKVGPLLMRVANGATTGEDATFLETMLKGVGEIAGKSLLFKSIGGAAAVDGDPEAQLQAKADEIRKADSKLTPQQAYSKAMEQHPELYTAYIAKRRG